MKASCQPSSLRTSFSSGFQFRIPVLTPDVHDPNGPAFTETNIYASRPSRILQLQQIAASANCSFCICTCRGRTSESANSGIHNELSPEAANQFTNRLPRVRPLIQADFAESVNLLLFFPGGNTHRHLPGILSPELPKLASLPKGRFGDCKVGPLSGISGNSPLELSLG